MELNTLKTYIKHIYQLESSIYSQSVLKNRIQNEISVLSSTPDTPFYETEKNPIRKGLFRSTIYFGEVGAVIGLIIGCLLNWKDVITTIIYLVCEPIEILETVFWIPSALKIMIIGAVFGAGFGVLSGLHYGVSGTILNRKIVKENHRILASNKNQRAVIAQKVGILQSELRIINSSLADSHRIVNQYYAMNVLAPKYQHNLVAVSSFYDYFSTGRTRRLDVSDNGADVGAYNLFEHELRQNIIIDKLDQILDKLEQIRQNQFMLYCAMEDCNQTLKRVGGQLAYCTDALQSIDNNQEIIRYNSTIIRQNSELQTWLQVIHS